MTRTEALRKVYKKVTNFQRKAMKEWAHRQK